MQKTINIFWFKRDLRLYDNDALNASLELSKPLKLIYIVEPSLVNDEHYSLRHWRFLFESLKGLNKKLAEFNTSIQIYYDEVKNVFSQILKEFKIENIFSTEESGLYITYNRDILFVKFCKKHNIIWNEFQNGGVVRGLKNRDTWRNSWYDYMNNKIS